MCRVEPLAAPSTYCAQVPLPDDQMKVSARARRDEGPRLRIRRVFNRDFGVYGVRKVRRQLGREDVAVARCIVARPMRRMGLQGVVRRQAAKKSIVTHRTVACSV